MVSEAEEDLQNVDTGVRQSPIEIDTSLVVVDPQLNRARPLKIVYPTLLSNLVILNTGYGWKLEIPEMIAAKTGELAVEVVEKNFEKFNFYFFRAREFPQNFPVARLRDTFTGFFNSIAIGART